MKQVVNLPHRPRLKANPSTTIFPRNRIAKPSSVTGTLRRMIKIPDRPLAGFAYGQPPTCCIFAPPPFAYVRSE
jgi:hypothetical protein